MIKEDLFELNGAGKVTKKTLMFLYSLSESTFDQNVRDRIGEVLTGLTLIYGHDTLMTKEQLSLKCAATSDSPHGSVALGADE